MSLLLARVVKFKNENVSHWRVRQCNKAVGQALSASWVGERESLGMSLYKIFRVANFCTNFKATTIDILQNSSQKSYIFINDDTTYQYCHLIKIL